MRIFSYMIIVIFCFGLFFSSCARIKEMNTPPDKRLKPGEKKLNRTEFVLLDETELNAKNVLLKIDESGEKTINYSDKSGAYSYNLSGLSSLRFSNTNYRYHGMVIGFFAGVIIPQFFRPEKKKRVDDIPYLPVVTFSIDKYTSASIIGMPVGAVIGYFLGSRYYYRWQDYNVNSDNTDYPDIDVKINRDTVLLRYTVRFR